MKILIAVDGSRYTAKAVNYLIKHREQFGGAQLTLLNVNMQIPGRAANHLGRAVVQGYYADMCEAALAPARRLLQKAGLVFLDKWLVGDPGDEVAKFAGKGKFDLVVMGSHGQGLFANLVLGSVATKVLAGCKVPVLVIR